MDFFLPSPVQKIFPFEIYLNDRNLKIFAAL